jgi:hypothetical protein
LGVGDGLPKTILMGGCLVVDMVGVWCSWAGMLLFGSESRSVKWKDVVCFFEDDVSLDCPDGGVNARLSAGRMDDWTP